MAVLGVDGTPDGWLAVRYGGDGYESAARYDDIESLWDAEDDPGTVLIDVPIGLEEASSEPRKCDACARRNLGAPRSSSVFPVPVRAAVHAPDYGTAKATQERLTGGSLGTQSWAICDRIAELDCFLRRNDEVRGAGAEPNVVREAHPEVCFWALNGEEPMEHSKTSQPLLAFWERVAVLEGVDDGVLDDISDAGRSLAGTEASNDDLLDAFALALTASSLTGSLETLPDDPERDPQGLPMEMVYATP